MLECWLVLSCQDPLGLVAEPLGSLAREVCEQGLGCGDTAYLVHNSSVVCVRDCVEGEASIQDFEPWIRPMTCAAIAVGALIFFTILYFGKTWTESRGMDRRQQQRRAEGPNWNRLKISVLASQHNQTQAHETYVHQDTPKSIRAYEMEMAMYDNKE